jgi:hypothetical protein
LYVEGDSAASTAGQIEAHLLTCTSCRDLAVELRETQAALKSLRQDFVSPAALSSVRNQVLAEIGRRGAKPLWGRWVYAIAGAVFVAVMVITLATYGRKPAPEVQPVAKTDSSFAPPMETTPPSDSVVYSSPSKTSSRPVKRLPQHGVQKRGEVAPDRAVHSSTAEVETIAGADASPEKPSKQVVVKLLTDDPNVVIYWLVDQNGGTL